MQISEERVFQGGRYKGMEQREGGGDRGVMGQVLWDGADCVEGPSFILMRLEGLDRESDTVQLTF